MHTHTLANGLSATNSLLQMQGDKVVVDVTASGSTDALRADLTKLGMTVTGEAGRMVSGEISVSALDKVANLPSVQFARPAYKPWLNAGSVPGQGDRSMLADSANRYLGFDGSGTTVGVLSDSYTRRGDW